MKGLRQAKNTKAKMVREKEEAEAKAKAEEEEAARAEEAVQAMIEEPLGEAAEGEVADAVQELKDMDFFTPEGAQNTMGIAASLRKLCVLASPMNVKQFMECDVVKVALLQMRLHVAQVISIVEAYREVLNRSRATRGQEPPPPQDNGVALYGCGLIDRLIPIDRFGKMKERLLEFDAISILVQIKRNYPFGTGSFTYACNALRKLVPPRPEPVVVIPQKSDKGKTDASAQMISTATVVPTRSEK